MQVHNVRLINIFIRNKRLLKHILILSRVRVMSDKTYLSGYMYAMEAVCYVFKENTSLYEFFQHYTFKRNLVENKKNPTI